MKKVIFKSIVIFFLTSIAIFPLTALSEQLENKMDMYAGYFSREGNNDSPAKNINSNIYIKIYKDKNQGQWIATLFIPYPYAADLKPAVINKVFDNIEKQTTASAYLRSKFNELTENGTVQIERFGYMDDKLIFECGALSPCSIKLNDGYLDLIKPGIINEHIIKYNHVVDQ